MADDRQGFEIRGTFYPWAQEMRMLDSLLVAEVTGMAYRQFLEAWRDTIASIEDDEEPDVDPVVMNGLIAVAIWQKHPEWARPKVVKFMQNLGASEFEIVTDDEDDEDGQSPPAAAPSGGASDSRPSGNTSPSASTSNGSQESHSVSPSPIPTGTPESVTGSPV